MKSVKFKPHEYYIISNSKSGAFLMIVNITIFFLIVILTSCSNSNGIGQESKTAAKRDVQVAPNKETLAIHKDTSRIVGYWFIPHSAKVNIHFYENGRFGFNDYNLKLDRYEYLTGIYILTDSTLILKYDDRPRQYFKFYMDTADNNYYITKKGYYFAKGDSL